MLKNDLRYIIKRVVVAVAIAFILFFLKAQGVLAESVPTTTNNYQLMTMYCLNSNGTTTCSDSTNTGYYNAGTWLNYQMDLGVTGSGTYYVISYNRSYATLTTGKTYTYTFRQQFNPKDYALLHMNDWQYQVYVNVGSNLSDSYVVNDSCSSRNIATHDYAIETTCTFEITSNASYVLVRTAFGRGNNPRTSYTMSNAHIESTLSETGAITSQTAVIKQEFQKLISFLKSSSDRAYEDQIDDSDANVDVSGMSGITGILPAGPVDSLISLPLTILNIFIDSTSGTCSPYSFTFVFNQTITLPCFDVFWNQVPTAMMLFLSDLPAVIIFVLWAKSVYKRVEKATTFETDVDDEWGGI